MFLSALHLLRALPTTVGPREAIPIEVFWSQVLILTFVDQLLVWYNIRKQTLQTHFESNILKHAIILIILVFICDNNFRN